MKLFLAGYAVGVVTLTVINVIWWYANHLTF